MECAVFKYWCKLVRVVDGDTIDIDLDLGFSVWVLKQRVRLLGINTPESRTRNLAEKKLGLLAKERLIELLPNTFVIQTYKDKKGKYGRLLGTPYVKDVDICKQLMEEGHAREYYGGKKEPWV